MTVYLDRRFRHVGRIKKAAGTTHKPTIKALNLMLDQLFNQGRLDVLREIQKGRYTLLQVYEFHRLNNIGGLPTTATMSQLEASMSAWIDDKECSEAHRRSLHQSLRHILSVSKKQATVADLPELLEELRLKLRKAKHAVSFNRAKAAVQAFVKSTLKKNHPLYFSVSAVEGLKVTKKREGNPLSPDDFRLLMDKLSLFPRAHKIAVAMAYSGMGWTEYTGRWEILVDRVRIRGTKRAGRDRFVPRIKHIDRIEFPYKRFRAILASVSNEEVTPYDFRRSYANWLEDAQIPRTRRKMYLGHGASDVTDLYERREVERFLAEDSERLKNLLGAIDTPALQLMEKA